MTYFRDGKKFLTDRPFGNTEFYGGQSVRPPVIEPTFANEIQRERAEFQKLRFQYDPYYEYSDDHQYWAKHSTIRRKLIEMKKNLGLFGQDLTHPVCNSNGSLVY